MEQKIDSAKLGQFIRAKRKEERQNNLAYSIRLNDERQHITARSKKLGEKELRDWHNKKPELAKFGHFIVWQQDWASKLMLFL